MIDLRTPLRNYLAVRRQLGFELKEAGRGLEDFVGFLERARAERVTTELAVAWAKLPVDAQPDHWRRRLGWVRGFARYLATIDPESDVPSKDLLPARGDRVTPHIYSEAEIVALMAAARTVRPPSTAASIETLIGLMASTGLRLGEALGLDRQHVDLDDGVLHVRAAKQSKQREVPLHPTTTDALRTTPACATGIGRNPRRRRSSSRRWRAAAQTHRPSRVPEADPPGRTRGPRDSEPDPARTT